MGNRWEDVEALLISFAEQDLVDDDDDFVQPCFVAFEGEALRFVAFLRPHLKGEYHDPMIELAALAAPLQADRIAVSMSARIWSMEDPIPPVTEDADLRQRILHIAVADATGGSAHTRSIIHEFDRRGSELVWGARHEMTGGEGFIPGMLAITVGEQMRHALKSADGDIALQAARCDALGHTLYLPPDIKERLTSADVASARWLGEEPFTRPPRHRPRRASQPVRRVSRAPRRVRRPGPR